MNDRKSTSTRKMDVYNTDNGTPFAYSMTSHKNIKVNAEVQPPLQLPGLVIFVHGVNSEGEWYDYAEESLCNGLNIRLGLPDKDKKHWLIPNSYASSHWNNVHTEWIVPPCRITEEGRSPVIRFYWGYRSANHETDSYAIPLKKSGVITIMTSHLKSVKAEAPGTGAAGPFRTAATSW